MSLVNKTNIVKNNQPATKYNSIKKFLMQWIKVVLKQKVVDSSMLRSMKAVSLEREKYFDNTHMHTELTHESANASQKM